MDAPAPLAFMIVVALAVAMPLAFGPGPIQRLLAGLLGVCAATAPFALRTSLPPVVQVGLTMLGCLSFLRFVDLNRMHDVPELRTRVWYATTPFDVRNVSRTRRRLPIALVAAVLGYGSLAALAITLLLGPASSGPARWLAGALLIYAGVDAVVAFIRLGYAAAGIDVPSFHKTPIRSRSLIEFWGVRWNQPVHAWLKTHCFMPLARRRRPVLGLVAAFAASGVLHFVLVGVTTGAGEAALAALFFVVQAALVAFERIVGVARWRPAAARAWTVSAVLITSPLLIAPTLSSIGL